MATQAITSPQAFMVAMIDRLIPPVRMVTAMASASTPRMGICEAMDWKLAEDQKTEGMRKLNAITTTAINKLR